MGTSVLQPQSAQVIPSPLKSRKRTDWNRSELHFTWTIRYVSIPLSWGRITQWRRRYVWIYSMIMRMVSFNFLWCFFFFLFVFFFTVGTGEAAALKKRGDARSAPRRWRPKKMFNSSSSSSSKGQRGVSAIGRRFRTITHFWWAVTWSRAAAASTLKCRGTTATCSIWSWTCQRWRRRRRTPSTVRQMLKSPPLQVNT